jgi:hypothetical protein
MRQRRYRIYLRYYEGGDVAGAVRDHFARRREVRNGDGPQRTWAGAEATGFYRINGQEPGIIPEVFIRKVASALVTACQILQYSRSGVLPVAPPSWQPITHLDMSMPNIFFQPPAQAGGVCQLHTKI